MPRARRRAAGTAACRRGSAGLVQDAVTTDWPQSFVDLLRQGASELVEPDDPPPEDIEPLR